MKPVKFDNESKNDNEFITKPNPKVLSESDLIKLSLVEKEKGNQYFKDQDFGQALIFYSKAIDLYPKDTVYLANRAMCYLKLER